MGAERPPEERILCGGIAKRSEGGGAGRPWGTDARGIVRGGAATQSHTPPPERSGAKNREGALHPPPDSDRRERRGGGTKGGGGRGQGLRAGVMTPTNRLRAQRTGKKRRRGNFRARTGREDSMDERPEQASGGERGDPKRATTTSMPPLC